MALTYKTLSKKPLIFLRLLGINVEVFREISTEVERGWKKEIEAKKKRHGRTGNLKTFEDKLLALFLYYRTYITHEFIGYLLGLDNSNICRLFKKLEPLVARKISIKRDSSLSHDEVVKVLLDVTEQPTQRPKYGQKKSYSGKKKRHSIKTEVVMGDAGRILMVSRSAKGRVHDFRIRKEGKHLPCNSEKYADSGYQGLQRLVSGVTLPFKGTKRRPLTYEQKKHNRNLASFRARIENKIRELKIFKIMSHVYRNFQKKHNMRFNIIAGMVNLSHGL